MDLRATAVSFSLFSHELTALSSANWWQSALNGSAAFDSAVSPESPATAAIVLTHVTDTVVCSSESRRWGESGRGYDRLGDVGEQHGLDCRAES